MSNLAWLEAVHKEVDHEDAGGDEEAALRLVQLHTRSRWSLVGHIQRHCRLKSQTRGLCGRLCNLLHIAVIPVFQHQ